MIDLNKHEFEQQEYEEFLGYVTSTWRGLFETDFREEVKIKKIIIHNYKNTFDVFVYIEDNVYYDIKDGELVEVACGDKPIKTKYTLRSENILYMIIKNTLIEDLGLTDTEFMIFDYIEGIEVDKELSKRLESQEEGWAEAIYCAIHNL